MPVDHMVIWRDEMLEGVFSGGWIYTVRCHGEQEKRTVTDLDFQLQDYIFSRAFEKIS